MKLKFWIKTIVWTILPLISFILFSYIFINDHVINYILDYLINLCNFILYWLNDLKGNNNILNKITVYYNIPINDISEENNIIIDSIENNILNKQKKELYLFIILTVIILSVWIYTGNIDSSSVAVQTDPTSIKELIETGDNLKKLITRNNKILDSTLEIISDLINEK